MSIFRTTYSTAVTLNDLAGCQRRALRKNGGVTRKKLDCCSSGGGSWARRGWGWWRGRGRGRVRGKRVVKLRTELTAVKLFEISVFNIPRMFPSLVVVLLLLLSYILPHVPPYLVEARDGGGWQTCVYEHRRLVR